MESNNQVRHEVSRGPITLDKISVSEYQKAGTKTAQIRQVVTTHSFYPSKKTDSSLQANIFDNKEFGFEEKTYTSTETRIAWIPVPENATEADVAAKLAAAHRAGACIYRVLNNAPILDENQTYAVNQGLRTIDHFANAQVVRFPENPETIANGTANKLTLDKQGRVQYRRTFFWKAPKEDQDLRGSITPYLSAEIKAELAGASVMQGQTI